MKSRARTSQQIPLDIAGSTAFGRYPKISSEQTFNMFVADGWLVPFAGYKFSANLGGNGRGLLVSTRANLMFAVAGSNFISISPNLGVMVLGQLATSTGDVFLAEDLAHNIAICDKQKIYVYNYSLGGSLTLAFTDTIGNPLDFTPTYIAMQDTRFIATDTVNSKWRLSDPTGAPSGRINFPSGASVSPPGGAFTGTFQSKPDAPIAVIPFPSRGNTLLINGSLHTEQWFDIGAQLFPYQKNTSFNIDYGCINATTIAYLDNLVAWVGINERTGPVIIFSNGQDATQISNDGINYKLATLKEPGSAYGWIFRQDGHLFYVVTFYDPLDNFSIAYDFTTKMFFTLTDENMNYFIAKNTVFFNNTYYFISINDGNLYEINSAYSTYQYQKLIEEIPRVRVCKTFRTPDSIPFIVNSLAFPIEQGIDPNALPEPSNSQIIHVMTEQNGNVIVEENFVSQQNNVYAFAGEFTNGSVNSNEEIVNNYNPAVDLSISIDGGETFGNFARMQLNPIGFSKNRFVYYNLGYANEFTAQFRFFGTSRFVATNGVMNIYV